MGGDTSDVGAPTRAARAPLKCSVAGSMCKSVRDRDLYGERAPAKIFINFPRKHVLKMKNKQMYKCNSREIHYASLQKLSGMLETAWEWGVRMSCWGLVGGIRVGPARATCHSGQASGRSSPARGQWVRSQNHSGCATWIFYAVTWESVKRQHHTAWEGTLRESQY